MSYDMPTYSDVEMEHPQKINSLTGLVGFEPTNVGVKVLCLTSWR